MRREAFAVLAAAVLIVMAPTSLAHAASAHAASATRGDLTPREPSASSIVYRADAIIAADPAKIWRLLVDLDGYANWNPWVRKATGKAEPGGLVNVDVVLGQHVMSAQHIVLTVDAERRFCWKDAGWNSWFVYGQRCRWLEPRADGTVAYRQELLLDGPLNGAADLATGQAMRAGMAAETAALKQSAEQAG